jgi:hypothetical protein
MGFPEGRKLARDVNKVTTECADRLGALMTQMSSRMDTANRILEGIASEETRTVYKPSSASADTVCSNSKVSLSKPGVTSGTAGKIYTSSHILVNKFKAEYNGEVTFHISCNYMRGEIEYNLRQIEPIDSIIFDGSMGSVHQDSQKKETKTKNFAVVEGAVYQIEIELFVKPGLGNNLSASADATASIRAIEETVTGTKTQYYYPAKGAPAIVSDSGTYELTGNGSGNKQSVIEDFFLSDLDGAVIVSFDVETYAVASSEYAYFALLPDISDWIYNNDGGYGFSGSELSESASTNSKASFVTTVEKGKQYSLLFNISYNQSLTISNISVSAIRTATAPITVPFVSVDEPIACTYNFSNSSKQGYILKKLPESIYEKNCNYLIAMQNDVYPGSNTYSADLVFFNMNTMSPDYYVMYKSNDRDWVARNSNTLGEFSAGNIFAVAVVNGEICVCGTPGSNLVTLADLVRYCPHVSATLY